MKNTVVLEMINNGEIEQLKALLTEEIYKDSIKSDGNAKSRYMAMKRYFKYVDKNNPREGCKYPCKDVEVGNQKYNSFMDGYSFALTTESIDTLETFDKSKGDYFDMNRFVNLTTAQSVEEVDLNSVLAEAKSKGYKYKKSELGDDFQFAFNYKDAYYKFTLLDKAYSIINDGEKAELYYSGRLSVLFIKTSIGIAGVCPMNKIGQQKTVISIEN